MVGTTVIAVPYTATNFYLDMTTANTEHTRRSRKYVEPHGIPKITIRYDKSKDTWVLFAESTAIGYGKTKLQAAVVRDEIVGWSKILALMFLHLPPTLSEAERREAEMQRSLDAIERGL